jgi:hypothetical protein
VPTAIRIRHVDVASCGEVSGETLDSGRQAGARTDSYCAKVSRHFWEVRRTLKFIQTCTKSDGCFHAKNP